MSKIKLTLKPIVNKKNGQINFSLKKKDLPKKMKDNAMELKEIEFYLEGWK